MPKFLVTGGAGFIGSNLVEALLRRGDSVRLLDNFSTGKRENLAFLDVSPQVLEGLEILEGDMTDLSTCNEAMQGIEYVMHQAAIPSVPRSLIEPFATNRANLDGTLNLLIAARDAGVRRIIFASSSSVYGDSPVVPKVETITPVPRSPYAVQKLASEHYMRIFYELYGLETVSLRYFNVFGPRQDPHSEYAAVIPRFIRAILSGDPPTIFGDGEQSRDFTYVDNVVQGNLLAVEALGAPGKVINLACGTRLTVNRLLGILKKIMGSDIEPIYTEPRAGDVRHSHADISLARDILNYSPEVHIEEGLRRTVEYFRKIL
nr:SDR family oxidoreductase [Desulfobacterales bacterium]